MGEKSVNHINDIPEIFLKILFIFWREREVEGKGQADSVLSPALGLDPTTLRL